MHPFSLHRQATVAGETHLCVGNDLSSVVAECLRADLLQGDCDTGDSLRVARVSQNESSRHGLGTIASRDPTTHVVVRSTLASREDGIVDTLLDVGFFGLLVEDQTGARSTESLVTVR